MSAASHIAIKGDLTMGRVADAMKRVTNAPKKRDLVIDLSGMTDADSSAIAFLMNCLRLGRERGAKVTFTSVPESITTLADIYGLKSTIADATSRA
jgi:phospholipid transport system transporter-binding protein